MKRFILLYWSLTVALAGFLFGFDTVVISGAEKALNTKWQAYQIWGSTDLFHGVIVMASALWGTVLGALAGAWPVNRWGRKHTLIAIGILYFVSAIGSAWANDPYLFAIFRFLGGIGIGASTIAAPAYIAEIAPANKRGKLVALYQFNIVLGILIAFVSNHFIAESVAIEAWRWMMGIEALPALIYVLMVLGVPKSPRWLILQNRLIEAKKVILKLNPAVDANQEVKKILEYNQKNSAKESIFTRKNKAHFFSFKYKTPLSLIFCLAAFNQLSGINAFLYYAPRIFQIAGLKESAGSISTIGVGMVNLSFTLLGMFLIDKYGRKQLMYIGSIGYIIALSLVSFAFASNWLGMHISFFFFIFIAAHAVGQGAVIWVFISELFPNHLRAQGQTLGTGTHWILAAIIPSLVPVLFSTIGPASVFLFFTLMMVLQLLWVIFKMPETKGLSLEVLAEKFTAKKTVKTAKKKG